MKKLRLLSDFVICITLVLCCRSMWNLGIGLDERWSLSEFMDVNAFNDWSILLLLVLAVAINFIIFVKGLLDKI